MKLSNGLVGHSGQYLVCAELSKRGWLASLTLANAEDIDVLAHHTVTKKNVALQVKTSSGSEPLWLLSKRNEGWSPAVSCCPLCVPTVKCRFEMAACLV
jgi:hypothetical protein